MGYNMPTPKYTPSSPEAAFGNNVGPAVRTWLESAGYKWDDDSFSIIPLDFQGPVG